VPLGVLSGVPDIITHAKFDVTRVRGFSAAAPPKGAISYTYSNDPYNSSALPCRLWCVFQFPYTVFRRTNITLWLPRYNERT